MCAADKRTVQISDFVCVHQLESKAKAAIYRCRRSFFFLSSVKPQELFSFEMFSDIFIL